MPAPYDLVIIGGGQGGVDAAIRAAQFGLRAAIIERDKLGGVCVHLGCIPTKALLHSAEVVEQLKDAAALGVEIGQLTVNFGKMQERKTAIVDRIHKGVQYQMRKHKIDVFFGSARFLSRTKVGVALNDGSETELDAKQTLIVTGSAPRSIPGVTIDNQRILDSTGALALGEVPKSIVILGSGAVGVEFASLFAALGSDVTLVELLPMVLPLEDEEIGRALERIFTRRGIKVRTGATAKTVTPSGNRLTVTLARGQETEAVEADYLLVAVGRGPLTAGLGLEAAGVAAKNGAITVDGDYRTSAPEVYAAGDVIGGPFRLAHVAAAEAIHAVEAMAGQAPRALDYGTVPRPTFSIPQVATVGLSEQQAKEQGREVKVGRYAFQPNSKAMIEGARDGFVKIVTDAGTGEILGIHMLGPSVTELLAEGVVTKYLEGTVVELGAAVHSHPTLAEAMKEAALDALGKALHV